MLGLTAYSADRMRHPGRRHKSAPTFQWVLLPRAVRGPRASIRKHGTSGLGASRPCARDPDRYICGARRTPAAAVEIARDLVMNELVTKTDLALALESQTYRLTIRLGSMIVVGIAALAILELVH
jgi:hypothetical protein